MPLLVEIIGEPGVGKTHLSLTFPSPYIFDTTPKREAEVIVYKLHGAEAKKRYAWVRGYQELVNGIKKVINANDVKTVIIDTGADLQGMAAEYEVERKDRERLLPVEYGRIREMIDEDVITTVIESGRHLVMTAQMDDEYIENRKTGRRVPKGYKRLAFQADLRILLLLGSAEVQVTPGGVSFTVLYRPEPKITRKALIVKNRFVDMAETGYQRLEGNITFNDIVALIPENVRSMVL